MIDCIDTYSGNRGSQNRAGIQGAHEWLMTHCEIKDEGDISRGRRKHSLT